MIQELLRNGSHFSAHATYLAEVHGQKKIVKAAADPDGIENLKREFRGLEWYTRRRNPTQGNPCRIVAEKREYLRTEIDYVEGRIPDCRSGLVRSAADLRSLISHYCEIWPKGNRVPLHGDFSLGNAVFNEKSIYIIDWEHFAEDAVPGGFDVVYLLLETLCLGMRMRSKPSPEEIKILADLLAEANTRGHLAPEVVRSPLGFLVGYMKANPGFWGKQMPKFPVFKLSGNELAYIDTLLNARLSREKK